MRVLVVPVGSAGDVHPFVRIALELQARGHDVTVVTNAYFAPLIERVGLDLEPIGTVEQFDAITANPNLWHRVHGLGVVAAGVAFGIAPLYRLIEREAGRGDLVVVAHALAFGARVAHEVLDVPLVTAHLAPTSIWSQYESPVMARGLGAINALPRPLKRALLAISDRLADRVLAPPVNRFRRELGLSPVRQIVSRWWHSPQRVVGLFPDWFAAPQRDWPPQVTLTGFPLYDERGATAVPPDLDAFLNEACAADDPPIVFAPGSGNQQARAFFAAACEACRRLGRRGVLLTRYTGHLPAPLPPGVMHADYAPFSAVLPRAAALVHHGGIGTAAQALAAGRPQLVMPMTFDQPDNAARLQRLGVGRWLPPYRFRGAAVARELRALLESAAVVRRCAEVARRFDGSDPVGRTCQVIEGCGRGAAPAGG
ncbi:MAG: glycosyltransferase [Acidobacteria bacterium]|nr:glycosyltransferase [Acidobacteriota bacterium]